MSAIWESLLRRHLVISAIMVDSVKAALKAALPPRFLIHLRTLKFRLRGPAEVSRSDLLCDRSKLPIDIGANVGAFAYLMLRHSAGVICYEPNPFLANVLHKSFRDRVQIIAPAVSDCTRKAALNVPNFPKIDVDLSGWVSLENTFDEIMNV